MSCFARNRTKYLVPPLFVSLVTIKKMSSGFSPLPHAHTPNTPRARSNVRALRHDVSHRPPRDGGQARRLQGCQVRTRHFRTSRFFVTSAFFGIRLEKRVGVAGERASPTRASAPSRDGGDRAIACHSARVLALGTRSRSSRVHHSSPTTFRRRRSWQKSGKLPRPALARDTSRSFFEGGSAHWDRTLRRCDGFSAIFFFARRASKLTVVLPDLPLALSHTLGDT